ncbi:groL1 [Symbiodinium necroappetens]|nr:groL1 [Symbiodinium necroappetens]
MIADAMAKVGGSGVISLEESQSTTTEVELTEGMNLDKGYLSPYLCLDASNPTSRTWEANAPLVLVTDQKISMAQQELIPILTIAKQMSKPLLVVADTIEKEVLATLIVNKIRGIVDCCAIQAPGFGDNRKAILQDIALVTNATYITEDLGRKLESITAEDFGSARRISVGKDSTTIVADAPKEALEERCEQLRRQIEETKSSYTKEQLEKRLAKLVGGVALIKVGATTETELKDKKLRLEDAINATKAAVDEGIVPGGGAALCHLSQALRSWAPENLSEDELKGALIVADSMSAPLKRIAANSGQNGELVAEKVADTADTKQGFDALMLQYADMLERGIIDPAKVTRSALQNATSIAAMILTTECVVVDADSKDDDADDGEEDFDDY